MSIASSVLSSSLNFFLHFQSILGLKMLQVCMNGWSFLMFYNQCACIIIVLLKHVVVFQVTDIVCLLVHRIGFLLLLFFLFVSLFWFSFVCLFYLQSSGIKFKLRKNLHFSKRCVRRVLIHVKENAIWNTKTGKPVILSLFRDGIVDILVLWNLPPIY